MLDAAEPSALCCATFSALTFAMLFLSKKPVTLGGVIACAVLSMSTTQATIGLARAYSGPEAPRQDDVSDMLTAAMAWARQTMYP